MVSYAERIRVVPRTKDAEGCGALHRVVVPLAMCSGSTDPYCLTCARFAPLTGEASVNAMTKPGLCHNYILENRTREIQIEGEKYRALRICPVCQQRRPNI